MKAKYRTRDVIAVPWDVCLTIQYKTNGLSSIYEQDLLGEYWTANIDNILNEEVFEKINGRRLR